MSAVLIDLVWHDRILSSSAFSRRGSVSIGGTGADVQVPFLPARSKYHLMDLGAQPCVRLPAGDHYLAPGETLKVAMPGDMIFLNIRQVPLTATAEAAALLDLCTSEVAGLFLALAFTTVFGTWMKMGVPGALSAAEDLARKPLRKAKVTFANTTATVLAPARLDPRPVKVPAMRRAQGSPGASSPAGNLLVAFGSRGVRDSLTQARVAGGGLEQAAGQATGRAGGSAQGLGAAGLKDTGGAGGRDTVTLGEPMGKKTLAPGYGVSGLARARAGISIGTNAAAEVSGGMDREAVRRVIREHIREIRGCYERELQSRPDLYGKLVLQWDIEAGGQVAAASVKSNSLGSERVAGCILAHLRDWRFPDPPINQIGRISYPFIFHSQ